MRTLFVVLALAAAVLVVPFLRAEERPADAAASDFPAGWVGRWRGPARVAAVGRPTLTCTMELRIEPTGDGAGYAWIVAFRDHVGTDVSYGDQVHAHVLRPVDRERGHWRIDQRNSIELDCFFLEDALHGRFDMHGNVLDACYAMRNGAVEFQSTNFGREPLTRTGGEDGVPSVASFELRAVQTARMTRVAKDE